MTDSQLIDKLLLEWSWRCEKGYPDLNNPKDLQILESLFQIKLQEQDLLEKKSKAADYVRDVESSEREGINIYVSTSDDKTPKDSETQVIKSNAARYFINKKGEYQKVEKEKEEEQGSGEYNKNNQEEEEEAENNTQYVKRILRGLGVDDKDIERATAPSIFHTADSIEAFKKNKDAYLKELQFLYDYKGEKQGRGELIPLIAIKGARLGGAAGESKDVIVGTKILEVKEISEKVGEGEFRTGASGTITGTDFLKNFETFKKYLNSFQYDRKYELDLRDMMLLEAGTISSTNLNQIRDLLKEFPISKESLSVDFERIKFRDKYYSISKGGQATFKLDDNGELVASSEQLEELGEKQVDLQKILNHPWVSSAGEAFEKDLDDLREKAKGKVDYYLFYKKDGKKVKNSNFIEIVKGSDPRIKINRIIQDQVNLKFVHGGQEATEKQNNDQPS